MTKKKKIIVGVSATFLILIILAGIILGIIVYSLSQWYSPNNAYIPYKDLNTVMQDDVVYLSNEFMANNNLEFDSKSYVELTYNRREVNTKNFTKRVENIDSYLYQLKSTDDNLPIKVDVFGIAGTNNNILAKCDKKTENGYKYAMENNGEIVYNGIVLSKGFVVRTYANKSLINKKNCILKVTVSMSIDDAQKYCDDEIIKRFDEILKSALANIVRYGE